MKTSKNVSDSPPSVTNGTGYFADTPGGSSSATSVSNARDAFAKKRYSTFSGLSYNSSRSDLNSAPDSLTDDWEIEEGGLEQVNVVVRVRPLSEAEQKRGDSKCVQIQHNSSSITLENPDKTKTFTFSSVFDCKTTQSEVLEKSGIQQMIEMAVDGYSCTTFAYGQTGSGKTYTLTGPINQESEDTSYGLIQGSFNYLFKVLEQRAGSTTNSTTFTLSATYSEIYNEQVKDLINPSGRGSLPVRWSKDKGFYVENLFVVDCETIDDLLAVLEEGMSQRQLSTNNINEYSSRSHTIVSLQIDSEMPDPEEDGLYITKHGRLSFVDLAGSEKVKELGNTGELLTETTNINKSLLTLGNCISALSDNRKRSGHIPYRDSKLTKLLADSLGGSGVTLMIACITPSSYCISESLSTLRYANRAKRIKNKPVIRMDPREKLILSLKREVRLLRNENVYLRTRLEFPAAANKPAMLRHDADGSMSVVSFTAEDALSGNKTPVPGDFDRSKGKLTSSLVRETKPSSEAKRSDTNSIPPRSPPSFTPKSAADTSLYEMLQEYMVENETLRSENSDLHNVRARAMTEHQHISKENDKLLTKLDQLERVFASSPFSMSRTLSGDSSESSSAWRSRSLSQYTPDSSPQGAGSRASSLLHSPDWQQAGNKPLGGSGGIDRSKAGPDSSGNQDQQGHLPPVDSKRGVPNGYRVKPPPYKQPSPPAPQYRPQPAAGQQPPVGSLKGSDGHGRGGGGSGPTRQTKMPQQRGAKTQNDSGIASDISRSFPPSKTHQGRPQLPANSLPSQSTPRGASIPSRDPQGKGRNADPPESSQARPQHKADIFIPSVPSMLKETAKNNAAARTDPARNVDVPGQQQDKGHRDETHTVQEMKQNNNKGKGSPKKPSKTIGSTAPPAVVTGYSNRIGAKKNNNNSSGAWGQSRNSEKQSPHQQRKDNNDASQRTQDLNALPDTPTVTPPPVKYKPKGTANLLAAATTDAAGGSPSRRPHDPESLQVINQKLRQELLDLDGEIEYMKYYNKAGKGGSNGSGGGSGGSGQNDSTVRSKGKRR